MPKKFVGEPFCAVFQKKLMDKRGRGGVSRFSVEKFLSHSAESFRRGGSFSVSLISVIEKNYVPEGYVTIFDFLSKFFCLTVPKVSVGEPFCAVFQKKFMDKRGGINIFRRKIFVSQCRNFP